MLFDDKGDGSAIFNDIGGFVDSRSDVFDKLDANGIETYWGDLIVEDATITNAKKAGVKSDFVNIMTVLNANISKSDVGIRADAPLGIINFREGNIKAKTNGISLNTMLTSGSSKIEKFDVISASGGGKSIGINLVNPWGNGLNIENNKYVESKKGNHAIYLSNPFNVKVRYNNIFSGESISSLRSEAGFNTLVGCNIIGGGQTTANLDIAMTEGAYVCNTMSGTAVGAFFDGGNGMTAFTGNDMSNSVGLKLNQTAVIGIQKHKGNIWQGSTAICENPNFLGSRFLVTTDFTCDGKQEYMPSSVNPQGWFSDLCPIDGDDTYDCSSNCTKGIGPHKLGNWHGDVLVHGFPESKFDKELTWLTRKQIYHTIKQSPKVLDDATPFFHTFETTTDNEAIGKLYEVENGIRNLNQFGTEISGQEADLVALLSQKLKACTALDKQIKLTREEELLISLRFQRLQIGNEINGLKLNLNELRGQMNTIRLNRISALTQLNQQIVVSNTMEYNERVVNYFVLTQMIKPRFKPSDEMLSDIAHIAIQCPITGGGAVYRARNIYKLKYPEEIFNDDNCNDNAVVNPINKVSKDKTDVLFKISPNPSSTYFTIELKVNDAENTKLELIDLLGRNIWQSQTLAEGYNAILVETNNIPEGVYTLVQTQKGNIVDKIKVIVNKN